jgi:hypothetical protein
MINKIKKIGLQERKANGVEAVTLYMRKSEIKNIMFGSIWKCTTTENVDLEQQLHHRIASPYQRC